MTGEAPRPRKRQRRLIGISLLPAAATLGNLLCGFFAVFCCLLAMRAEFSQEIFAVQPRVFFERLEDVFPTHIAAGAYLVLLAMIFDTLDGRLARMTRRTSEFGAQLDSIADIVSFGVAPAMLFVTLLLRPAPGTDIEIAEVSILQQRIGIVCALVYVSCAAIRLARFNVEHGKKHKDHRAFSGLPSPAGAACIIALLALHEVLRDSGLGVGGISWAGFSRWIIALATFGVGLLMVSRIDYVHVFNVYLRRKHPPTYLVWLVAIVGVVVGVGYYSFELLLVLAAFGYTLSGVGMHLAQRRRAGRELSETDA